MILKKRSTAYSEIENSLKTGDIILMHGRYPSSHVIEAFEGSDYSHAAMIVRAKDLNFTNCEELLLWESNVPVGVNDIILKEPKSGPQLVNLHEKLLYDLENKLDSKVAVRHLYADRTPEMFTSLLNAINEVHNATFPNLHHECQDPIEGRFRNVQTPYDTLFCSELVAFTYTRMGLLSSIHPTNSYFPVDFSEKLDVGLLKRAWLGREIIIEPKM